MEQVIGLIIEANLGVIANIASFDMTTPAAFGVIGVRGESPIRE
jgi:hypothetical protein